MNDPIAVHERLERIYRMYVESAFPLRYPDLASERRELLAATGVLAQPPLIEPVPVYASSDLTLEQAAAQLPPAYGDLPLIAGPLFPNGRKLYAHQWRALHSSVAGQDVVVTTGTGSGKTESFMLPLLASLAAESVSWPDSAPEPRDRFWWRDKTTWSPQWGHSLRPHAMRAIILYPLNALVEDQMRRLRSVLDSPEVSSWLNTARGGNRFTFGRYTGLSPVAGGRAPEKEKRLRSYLKAREAESRAVREQLRKRSDGSEYHFPALDGGEIWSRWDAQVTPPDLLITNYSMLNIMLMRAIEAGIFEQTKAWLAEDPRRVFHLVVDELHAYRGTPGTEVSYILRLLLERLGLSPDSTQLRILATSASLEGDASGFLSEFFGRPAERFEIIGNPQAPPVRGADLGSFRETFSAFAKAVPAEPLLSGSTPVSRELQAKLTRELLSGRPVEGTLADTPLITALQQVGLPEALRAACQRDGEGVKATPTPKLAERLFGAPDITALRGALLALATARLEDGTALQPVRAHLFFQNVQNLWVCTQPACRQSAATPAPNIGSLHEEHRLTCTCGSRVLELIVCEVCGEVFLGGQRKVEGKREAVSADRIDLEGIPDQLDGRAYGQYAVMWPVASHAEQRSERDEFKWSGLSRRWQPRYFERRTGQLVTCPQPPAPEDDMQPVWVYTVSGKDNENASAFPLVCPCCDADYKRREVLPSPLRHHRTGFQKAAQVIASTLMREVDADSRKLVVFSDSRQDAARLAAGMERDHYRDMVRVSLLAALESASKELEAIVRVYLQGADSPAARQRLGDVNPLLLARALEPATQEDEALVRNSRSTLAPYLLSFFMGFPLPGAQEEDLRRLLEQYPARVPLGQLRDAVFSRLLEHGICPGGNTLNALYYKEGNAEKPWHSAFKWSADGITVREQDNAKWHERTLKELLLVEMMMVLFTHQVRTLESVGQGYVHAPLKDSSSTLQEATDVIVRFLGIKRRYANSEFIEPGEEITWPKPVKDYLKRLSIDADAAREALQRSELIESSQTGAIVRADNLVLVGKREGQASYRCKRCRALYLHAAAGFCIHCQGEVAEEAGSADDAEQDYYTYLARHAGGAFRLNAEELTGQTDTEARALRQRRFQDVFLEGENDTSQGVDLLSVTTTMEAGVDIGSLNAVLMSNMPPRRFNYQQRVGRAGRRGAALSLAVTLCRGRSHDAYYYANTEAITGDPPPPPYVDTASSTIFERVLNKEVLRRALGVKDSAESTGESVHGEFGSAADWQSEPSRRAELETFLKSEAEVSAVKQLACNLSMHTRLQPAQVQRALEALQELPRRIDEVARDGRYTQEALSERLAYCGLLPMFGFPTRTRVLYLDPLNRIDGRRFPPTNVIDRDLEHAIGTFAPGAEVVRDKRVHRAIGVVNLHPAPYGQARVSPGFFPPLGDLNQRPLGVCRHCQAVHESEALKDHVADVITCPTCGELQLRVLDTREPRHFYTDGKPRDYNGFFEVRGRSTRPTLAVKQDDNGAVVNNARVFSGSKEVLTFNDHYGRGGFLFVPDKLTGAYCVADHTRQASPRDVKPIALLARRTTDTLQIGMNLWPIHHHARPEEIEGRAAWYSLAFALRSAACNMLDIEPNELECGLYVTHNNGRAEAQAFMSDKLENGAGYATYLADAHHFQRLISVLNGQLRGEWDAHASRCDSSCAQCLRDYTNLPYHPLLDWRLALDMIRLLSGAAKALSFQGSYWEAMLGSAAAPLSVSLEQLGYTHEKLQTPLPVFTRRRKREVAVVIVKHPLWEDTHPDLIHTLKMVEKECTSGKPLVVSPFLLLRRPSAAL